MANTTRSRSSVVLDALRDRYPTADGWTLDLWPEGAALKLTATREGRVLSYWLSTARRSDENLVLTFAKVLDDMDSTRPEAIAEAAEVEAQSPARVKARGLAVSVSEKGGSVSVTGPGVEGDWTPKEALDFAARLTKTAQKALGL